MIRKEIISRAEHAFDENDFSSAIKDYQLAATMAPTDLPLVLGNLVQAREYEHLQFIRELKGKFTDSLEVQLHEAWFFSHIGRPSGSVKLYSKLLEGTLTAEQELAVRHARLKATAKTKEPTSFLEDFQFLWNVMILAKQRQYLLRICSGIEAYEFVPVLEELSQNGVFPVEARSFFEIKASELRYFQDASR